MPQPMTRKEIIEALKLEIQIIERGGYGSSVRTPRKDPTYIRDSITCLNYALEEKQYPCEQCFLIEFVPPELRNTEEPCHHIPLNEKGDTIVSLAGKRDRLEKALLDWLRTTVDRLEQEEREETGRQARS